MLVRDSALVDGHYLARCRNPRGIITWEQIIDNLILDAGLTHMLATELGGATQVATWYLGLIDNAGYTAIAAADTMGSHAGWVECTAYTGNRPAWTPGTAAAKSIVNPSTVNFAITATKTIKGLFLFSAATGTTGVLFSAGAFTGGTQVVNNLDTLEVTYQANATSS